jgi:hypothetical protein
MSDEIYGADRADRLVELLRELAVRIMELDDRTLLAAGPELLKRMGDIRSELFHYEVRSTYDTPEVAEGRRIVEDARRGEETLEFDDEDVRPWQDSDS